MPIIGFKKPKTPDKEWISRSSQVLAQGFPGTNSKRWDQYVSAPSHIIGGERCYLLDAWNNRYIDFVSALGPNLLGYGNPQVTEAVYREIKKGPSHSLPTTLEVEAAEELRDFIAPIEKIRFLNSGSEACLAAIRIARAHTNRSLILSSGYHGHGDIFTSLTQPRRGVRDKFFIHDLTKFTIEDIEDLGDLAAIIVEPVELEFSENRKQWLQKLRDICTKKGACLIFDEVITGFRVPKGSVAEYWNIWPDIMILGKAIANGFRLSVVGGKKEVMDVPDYFISSTYSGETSSLAALRSVIHQVRRNKNLDDLFYYGDRLRHKLNDLHSHIKFEGYGTRAMLNTTNLTTALFMQEMVKCGVLFGKAWFFNFSHFQENIEKQVIDLSVDVIDRIKRGKVKLESSLPKETFKR